MVSLPYPEGRDIGQKVNAWSTHGAAVCLHKRGDFSMSNLDNAEMSLFSLLH